MQILVSQVHSVNFTIPMCKHWSPGRSPTRAIKYTNLCQVFSQYEEVNKVAPLNNLLYFRTAFYFNLEQCNIL